MPLSASDRAGALLARVAALVPAMQGRAAGCDADDAYPDADMTALGAAGLLTAPLPRFLGGFGAGTEPDGAALVLDLLRVCGRGSLAIARLFEAHVNALRLVLRYGTPDQLRLAARDVQDGHLFGLWVTDPAETPLIAQDDTLHGCKGPCSGAGHCTRALVTAAVGPDTRMALIALRGDEPVIPLRGLQGMRAAANGTVTLDAAKLLFWLGGPGDYLREPDFSCGAWRASAAVAGGLDALVEAVGATLARKGHAEAPLQQARFGEMLVAQETARLWLERAAALAEAADADPAFQIAYVNLARIAIEAACLDALRLAQRSLGLAAFVAPHPVERLLRDIATYLRQPAPDSVLLEAASWHLRRVVC
ncbi:MAG: hypothetical protein NVSMB18_25180 [Acetobacteraceae bacterium]